MHFILRGQAARFGERYCGYCSRFSFGRRATGIPDLRAGLQAGDLVVIHLAA